MKHSKKDIEKLIKNIRYELSDEADKRILGNVLRAFDESKEHKQPHRTTNKKDNHE